MKYFAPAALLAVCIPALVIGAGYDSYKPPEKDCHKETYECGKEKYQVHVDKKCYKDYCYEVPSYGYGYGYYAPPQKKCEKKEYDCGYDEWKVKPKYCEKEVCKPKYEPKYGYY